MAKKKGGDKKKDTGGDKGGPEDKAASEIKALNLEKENLTVELALTREKARKYKEENNTLADSLNSIKAAQETSISDAADILEHKQQEIMKKEDRIIDLEGRLKNVTEELEEKSAKIGDLEAEIDNASKTLKESSKYKDQIQNLEGTLKEQDSTVMSLSDELEKAQRTLEEVHLKLGQTEKENDELRLKAEGETKFMVLFGEPWLVKNSKYRLRGDLPMDNVESTLTCIAGKSLVLIGGYAREAEDKKDLVYAGTPSDMNGICICNLENNKWEVVKPKMARLLGNKSSASNWKRAGHASCIISATKVIVLGGKTSTLDEKEGQSIQIISNVGVFNIDTMKWSELITKGQCGLREGHAACPAREKLILFGGTSFNPSKGGFKHLYGPGVQNDDLIYHNDVFMLDFETMQWHQPPQIGSVPAPMKGCTLCCTDDGRHMWLFGGFNGTVASNEVNVLEIETFTWTNIQVGSARSPQARYDHSATLSSEYLFISGGVTITDSGRSQILTDLWVLDLQSLEWQCLQESTPELLLQKPTRSYSTFHGSQLFRVKANPEGKLDEIEIVDITLPQNIQGLNSQQKYTQEDSQDKFELIDTGMTTSNTIEVVWRPPAKNLERIKSYKLMMATNTGVVKEICEGKYTRFKVMGLRPNTQYIFCVKALFGDGSFLWSDSKSFRTK